MAGGCPSWCGADLSRRKPSAPARLPRWRGSRSDGSSGSRGTNIRRDRGSMPAAREPCHSAAGGSSSCEIPSAGGTKAGRDTRVRGPVGEATARSEEHTSELQSRLHLVCRLLLEKKKKKVAQALSGKTL